MRRNLHFIFGDQLSLSISNLQYFDKHQDIILMCEVIEEATYAWHHPKKIALIFSAMRHFALELESIGYKVDYIKLDDKENSGSFDGELKRAILRHNPQKILLTEPSEFRVFEKILNWQESLDVPIEIFNDERFLCSKSEFFKWARNRKEFRLEFFYREMRKKYKILVDENLKPIEGKWNFDSQNRKIPKQKIKFPKRIFHKKTKITLDVIDLVKNRFAKNFGDLLPFNFAVTRSEALLEAEHFMEELLPNFGDYQDAMLAGEPYLYHSLLSSYINIGLLLPLEICQMAERKYQEGKAKINAVEGFIRQILGWREYVRGIYWLEMPRYVENNFLGAKRSLPEFYWGKKTSMFCLNEAVNQTRVHAYSHHIQRLMITGNFALITGLNPKEVHQWYLAVYADAFDWVEVPNTIGMALYADGGLMASKPYAASAKYISKMGNFCKSCIFDPEKTIGENSCPFNSLYWNFMISNENKLKSNQRLKFVYPTWYKMKESKREEILKTARKYLLKIEKNEL